MDVKTVLIINSNSDDLSKVNLAITRETHSQIVKNAAKKGLQFLKVFQKLVASTGETVFLCANI